MHNIKIYIPLLLTLVVFYVVVQIFETKISNGTEMSSEFFAPPPEYVEYFTFGFNESIADSLWIRWIQDGDKCVKYQDIEQTASVSDSQDPDFTNPRHKVCDNSWSFKMIDAVTKIAPRFKMPYEAGAITLSVLTEDYKGADVIFDRGVKQFPEDWTILYRAAYHYLYDQQNLERAADLLTKASYHGAPEWLKLLASRLYSKTGQIELGLANLVAYRETIKDKDNKAAFERVDKRIAELREKLKAQQSAPQDPAKPGK